MDFWSAVLEVVKVAVAAYVGFRFGLRSTRLRLEWEREHKARDDRRRLIHQARVHLEQIRQEIERNEKFYFTKESEPRISTEIRTAIFSLDDRTLVDEFHAGQLSMREMAWGSDRKSSGGKFMPSLRAMLTRLDELEVKLEHPGGQKKGIWPFRRNK